VNQAAPTKPVLERLKERFGDRILATHQQCGDATALVAPAAIVEICAWLKSEPGLEFEMLIDLTAVDYLKRRPRFEVVYHLYSLQQRQRVRLKVPADGDQPEVPTLTSLWRGANWYEREVWDLFGIRFTGHPDLRRIMMYPEFVGHPLRKDYPYNKRQPRVPPRSGGGAHIT
jgi:NADH-quinone oxidoreductase subunit C